MSMFSLLGFLLGKKKEKTIHTLEDCCLDRNSVYSAK